MVALTEPTETVVFGNHARILVDKIDIHAHRKRAQEDPVGAQDAPDLGEGFLIVAHMLAHVVGDDDIVRGIGKPRSLDIELQLRIRIVEVRGRELDLLLTEPGLHGPFRCEVEDVLPGDDIHVFIEVIGEDAVAGKRAADRAEDVLTDAIEELDVIKLRPF